jgi:adenosine kinase
VPVVVTGSIANDFLMTFPGRFRELIVAEQLERLSLSFLVDELQVRRGGVGANICFGMAQLGLRPVLVGAVGDDFADYRSWLERHGIDTGSVHVSAVKHTARFHCTTDRDNCQIASFYAGAMEEARNIELHPVAARVGPPELVVVSPNDPVAMLRHTDEARQAGIPFVADPSQQLARMDGGDIRRLVDGAAYLVTNDYEATLLESKTGWSADDVLDRVGVRVTTHGGKGCVVEQRGAARVEVPAFPETSIVDPTGVGDSFRAGFLGGRVQGLSLERSAQLGSFLATLVLESVGTQEYLVEREVALERVGAVYGGPAASEVVGHLPVAAA